MPRYDQLTRADLDRIERGLKAPAGICTDARSCARADALTLLSELRRARLDMALTRARHADQLAAARATLSAQADGEADPLAYLRDQLDEDFANPSPSGWGADAPVPYLPTVRANRALRTVRTPGGDAA